MFMQREIIIMQCSTMTRPCSISQTNVQPPKPILEVVSSNVTTVRLVLHWMPQLDLGSRIVCNFYSLPSSSNMQCEKLLLFLPKLHFIDYSCFCYHYYHYSVRYIGCRLTSYRSVAIFCQLVLYYITHDTTHDTIVYRGYHSFSAVVICYCLLCWKVATLLSEEVTICIVWIYHQ